MIRFGGLECYRAPRCWWISKRCASSVTLSRDRLEELLESEITHFAHKQRSPMTLQQIICLTRQQDAARYIHEELPTRFAVRIKQLESLNGHSDIPLLAKVRSVYAESFKSLRMSDPSALDDFTRVIGAIKKRHSHVVPHLVAGLRQLRSTDATLSDQYIDNFLDHFFMARLSTEMLSSHYIAVSRGKSTGIIDPGCDPLPVLKKACADAEALCRYHYRGRCPSVIINTLPGSPIRFPYIPQYLYYILFEIIKNAMRAVVEEHDAAAKSWTGETSYAEGEVHHSGGVKPPSSITTLEQLSSEKNNYGTSQPRTPPSLPPLTVVVSGDAQEVGIKISDEGGGIDAAVQEKIWSYLYTTAHLPPRQAKALLSSPESSEPTSGASRHPSSSSSSSAAAAAATSSSNMAEEASAAGVDGSSPMSFSWGTAPPNRTTTLASALSSRSHPSPLAGFGCGLPLSRLYARYLDGRLSLMSMPKWGTDAFLFLRRIGEIQESSTSYWLGGGAAAKAKSIDDPEPLDR